MTGEMQSFTPLRVAIVVHRGRRHPPLLTLDDRIRRLGHVAFLVPDGQLVPESCDLVLLRGNVGGFPHTRRQLLGLPRERRPRSVVWHMEPLPLPSHAGFPSQPLTFREWVKRTIRDPRATDPQTNARAVLSAVDEGWLDTVVPISAAGEEYLDEHGVRSVRVEHGVDPNLMADPLSTDRDVDALFLGEAVRRRRRIIRMLRRHGIDVTAAGSFIRGGVWGEERSRLLNRTKVMLNIQRFPGQSQTARFLLAIHHGALTVSEPIYRPEPFVPGVHYVEAPLEELPAAVAHWIEDEEARTAMVEAARPLAERLTATATLARVIDAATAAR